MTERKAGADERWKAILKDVVFEFEDREVFDIEDPRKRAQALRRYFFPKLNVLLNSGRSLIAAIYGGEALDVFTEAQSPKPKEGDWETKKFDAAHLGLVGVRVESGLSLLGSNGKPVQYGISHLWFEVFRRGTLAITFIPMMYGKDKKFETRVSNAFREYEDALCTICSATFVSNHTCMMLGTFSEALEPKTLRETPFASRGFEFPVGRDDGLLQLVAGFAALFPFQKLVTDLSMSRPTTIESDLDALWGWWDENGPEIFVPERAGIERVQPEGARVRVDWESDTRAMVTAGQRFRIFDRDDYRCLACGRSAEGDGVVLHVDHITPRSKGGSDDDENLQTLCAECNLGKGNRSDRDLRER